MPTVSSHRSWLQSTLAYAKWTIRTTWRNGEQLLLVIGIPFVAFFALTRTALITQPEGPYPVVAAMIVLGSGFTSPAITIAFDRRYGSYAFLGTTPLSRSSIIVGTLASITVTAIAAVVLIVAIGSATGSPPSAAGIGPLLAATALGLAAVVPWAFLLGGTARSETVLALANGAFVVLVLFGGVLIPAGSLPGSTLIGLLPSAAIVSMAGGVTPTNAAVLGAWSVLGVLLATRAFRWR